MAEASVLFERDGKIGWITLNRGHRYNSFDVPTIHGLYNRLEECADDDAIRAVVITGVGKAFCTGADIVAMKPFLQDGLEGVFKDLSKYLHGAIIEIRRMNKPVVAAINGVVAGGGYGLALACDIRIASERAKFRPAYFKLGLVPAGGITYFLPRIVGHSKAAEIVLLDKVLDAQAAMELGIVGEVVPHDTLKERARATALKLTSAPPFAVTKAKELLYGESAISLESQLEIERRLTTEVSNSSDFLESLKALFEKREPRLKSE